MFPTRLKVNSLCLWGSAFYWFRTVLQGILALFKKYKIWKLQIFYFKYLRFSIKEQTDIFLCVFFCGFFVCLLMSLLDEYKNIKKCYFRLFGEILVKMRLTFEIKFFFRFYFFTYLTYGFFVKKKICFKTF